MSKGLVLITGASSGIGHACALEAAKRGYDTLLVARRADRLQALKSDIESKYPGRKAEFIVSDVCAPDYESKLRAALPETRDLQMAIVNAGVGSAGRFEKIKMDVFEHVMNVNVLAAIRTSQIVLPNLKRTHGYLGLVGSMNSHIANPLMTAYATSKFALRGFAEALRMEVWSDGVKVSLICPGPVETEIFNRNHKGEWVDHNIKLRGHNRLAVDVAARRIFDGMLKAKRDFSLTAGTNFARVLSHYMPGAISFVQRTVYGRNKEKFHKLVGTVNPDSV